MKPKPRASWRRPFRSDTGSPIHALALHVNDPAKVDNAKLLALFDRKETDFEAALANILNEDAPNSVVDLTDAEVAYCAGWALLAELEYGKDPAILRQAIKRQIDAMTMMNDGGGPASG